jgi:hypothetical protein
MPKLILSNRILFLFFTVIFIINGCEKDNDNPVTPSDDKYFWIHFENDSTKKSFENLPKFTVDGQEAIQLSSFVDTTIIPLFYDKNNVPYDARPLYSYQIVGDDGFCASNKGYCNNILEHLQLGYVLTSDRKVIFPDEQIDLPGAYNIKSASHIYIHRKFDLDFTDSTLFVELKNVTPVQVTNSNGDLEDAIQLRDIVIYAIGGDGGYNYNIRSLDDFGPTEDMTWEQFQTGYWLLTSQKTMFTDTSLAGGSYKLKVLEKILLK